MVTQLLCPDKDRRAALGKAVPITSHPCRFLVPPEHREDFLSLPGVDGGPGPWYDSEQDCGSRLSRFSNLSNLGHGAKTVFTSILLEMTHKFSAPHALHEPRCHPCTYGLTVHK